MYFASSRSLEGRKELRKWFPYVWVVTYKSHLYHFPTWFTWNPSPFVPPLKKKKKKVFIHLHYLSLENKFSNVIIILLNILLNIDNLCNTYWKIERDYSVPFEDITASLILNRVQQTKHRHLVSRNKIFSRRILPPSQPPVFPHSPPISGVFSTWFGSKEQQPQTQLESMFWHEQTKSASWRCSFTLQWICGICNAGICSYIYTQTAAMELHGLEEMAVSDKTGFCGSLGAKRTGQRTGWRIINRQCQRRLGTVASKQEGITGRLSKPPMGLGEGRKGEKSFKNFSESWEIPLKIISWVLT